MAKILANVFAQFQGHEPKKAFIEALGGAEIEYRTLTMKENDDFQKRTVKGFDSEGKPEFNYDEFSKIKYEKVAMGLIEPAMTVEELNALDGEAAKAIAEIEALISGTSELVDEEGN